MQNLKLAEKIQIPEITNLNCPLYESCSGCNVKINLTSPPIYFEAKQFLRQYGVYDFELIWDQTQEWRNRSKLAVRGNVKNPKIGLFKQGTHNVIDMDKMCQMHHPLINEAINICRKQIIDCKIYPYKETKCIGWLRYIQLTVVNSNKNKIYVENGQQSEKNLTAENSDRTKIVNSENQSVEINNLHDKSQNKKQVHIENRQKLKIQNGKQYLVTQNVNKLTKFQSSENQTVENNNLNDNFHNKTSQQIELVLVLNMTPDRNEVFKQIQDFVEKIWKSNPNLFFSIWLNFQNENTNSIFGKEWKLVRGGKFASQNYLRQKIYFHPGSFQQANTQLMNFAIQEICMHIPNNKKILELHAGAGVIGLCVAKNCSPNQIFLIESNDSNKEYFHKSLLEINNNSCQIDYIIQDASFEIDKLIKGQNILIVDPPRKGLEGGLMNVLVGEGFQKERGDLEKLIYLSCGFSSLKRDLGEMIGSGFWEIEKCVSYLFFPGTNSIETLVILNCVNKQ